MRRTIFAAVPLAVLALAAPAAAHGNRHATTYRAALTGEGGVEGRAQFVDNKRRDKLSVHLRGVTAGEDYTWQLREASGDGDACNGDAVEGFTSRKLGNKRHGRRHFKARSRSFAAEDGVSYAVVILDEDGNVVACGELKTRAQRKAEREAAEHQCAAAAHEEPSSSDDNDEQGDDDAQGDEERKVCGDDEHPESGDDQPSGDETPEPADEPAGTDD